MMFHMTCPFLGSMTGSFGSRAGDCCFGKHISYTRQKTDCLTVLTQLTALLCEHPWVIVRQSVFMTTRLSPREAPLARFRCSITYTKLVYVMVCVQHRNAETARDMKLVLFVFCLFSSLCASLALSPPTSLRLASWNVQNFGQVKAKRASVMQVIAEVRRREENEVPSILFHVTRSLYFLLVVVSVPGVCSFCSASPRFLSCSLSFSFSFSVLPS